MEWSELPVQERMARKFSMESNDEKRVEVPLPEVVVPGHEIEAELLPKQPQEIATLLAGQGRIVVARHSRTLTRGTEYKTGKRQGEMRPDKLADHYSLITLDAEWPLVYAVWLDGKLAFAKIGTRAGVENFHLVTELKKRLQECA